MHKRIRYHFVTDLHVTRHACETESERRIRNTPNKPCRVDLVTSPNRDYRPLSHNRAHFIPLYTIENSPPLYGFVHEKPNIDEYFWIWSSVEVRNDTESAWIIVEGSRSRKLDFPNICIKPFPSIFQIHITIIWSPMLLIHFFYYFRKWKWFLPFGACAFLTSSFHFPLDTVFNQTR